MTFLPAVSSSWAATSPARPAPTTMTSVSTPTTFHLSHTIPYYMTCEAKLPKEKLQMSEDKNHIESTKASVLEVAALFLRLGMIAFGGPAAHIALFREEFVMRRQWLSDDEFLDMLGATNMIPGPNS